MNKFMKYAAVLLLSQTAVQASHGDMKVGRREEMSLIQGLQHLQTTMDNWFTTPGRKVLLMDNTEATPMAGESKNRTMQILQPFCQTLNIQTKVLVKAEPGQLTAQGAPSPQSADVIAQFLNDRTHEFNLMYRLLGVNPQQRRAAFQTLRTQIAEQRIDLYALDVTDINAVQIDRSFLLSK
ncbi:MAG: hypothetical protein LBJ92_03155 [Holosporales bacterium]|jgi:hypothetical protein|nr:hypothetical protein [Holosporales bacterium]